MSDIWTSLPMPALLVDAAGTLSDANPAAEDFLNRPARLAKGQNLSALLELDPGLSTALRQAWRDGGRLFVKETLLGVPPRPAMPCMVQSAPLTGSPDLTMLVITPLDPGHAHRGDSPRAAVQSAIGMAEMLAHEIKNPLAGITGAAQLLQMEGVRQDLTDLIVSECQRVVKLLDQVEQFGNLSPPDLQPVNLHDVLDRARQSAVLGFAGGIPIIEDYDPSLPLALVDADQLLQAVLNLLKNAAQALTERGHSAPARITLRSFYDHTARGRRADAPGQKLPLQIEVVDNGPGLPAEIREAAFDPFVSGRENGTGLGLALVSKIIADHGGLVTVSSAPGCTAFRLSLPRAVETKGS